MSRFLLDASALPLIDALIAAAARERGACLVHRDQHMVSTASSAARSLGVLYRERVKSKIERWVRISRIFRGDLRHNYDFVSPIADCKERGLMRDLLPKQVDAEVLQDAVTFLTTDLATYRCRRPLAHLR